MKNLLLAMTIVLTATSAQAANFAFESTDNSDASNLCIIAVEQGIKAADKAARSLGKATQDFVSIGKCNGMSVKSFAKSYEVKVVKPVTTAQSFKAVSFVAANDNKESAVCVQAATQGVSSISAFEKRSVICNGRSIRKFAALYSAQ